MKIHTDGIAKRLLIFGFMAMLCLISRTAAGTVPSGRQPALNGTTADTSLRHSLISDITISDIEDHFRVWDITYYSTGLKVKGLLYTPDDPDIPGTQPGIVFNHGGVGGIPGPTKLRCRELVEMGYVVIAPAYRGEGGSEGEIEVAEGEVDDALAAFEILRSLPAVDPARVGMMGTSHGGIVTLLAIERDPDIAAAVCAYGVTNTFSWYKYLVDNGFDVSDPLSLKVYGKGPDDKPAAFRKRAPALDAHLIETPLMLIYGENDNIVPVTQAKEMAAALDRENRNYELHIIPGMGHGLLFFTDPERRSELEIQRSTEAWNSVVEFLDRHLKNK